LNWFTIGGLCILVYIDEPSGATTVHNNYQLHKDDLVPQVSQPTNHLQDRLHHSSYNKMPIVIFMQQIQLK
jgi:hypothetical protein